LLSAAFFHSSRVTPRTLAAQRPSSIERFRLSFILVCAALRHHQGVGQGVEVHQIRARR